MSSPTYGLPPPVTEIKRTVAGETLRFACRALKIEPSRAAVLVYVAQHGWSHEQPRIVLPPGGISLGYYWTNRRYNVFQWLHPSGETIGHYFNVADETVVSPTAVEWLDLIVDYWIGADGTRGLLDEEEVPPGLAQSHRSALDAGLHDVLRQADAVVGEVSASSERHFSRLVAGGLVRGHDEFS
jgi:predicted RNA-binding protein associated with RNAse of E/G family